MESTELSCSDFSTELRHVRDLHVRYQFKSAEHFMEMTGGQGVMQVSKDIILIYESAAGKLWAIKRMGPGNFIKIQTCFISFCPSDQMKNGVCSDVLCNEENRSLLITSCFDTTPSHPDGNSISEFTKDEIVKLLNPTQPDASSTQEKTGELMSNPFSMQLVSQSNYSSLAMAHVPDEKEAPDFREYVKELREFTLRLQFINAEHFIEGSFNRGFIKLADDVILLYHRQAGQLWAIKRLGAEKFIRIQVCFISFCDNEKMKNGQCSYAECNEEHRKQVRFGYYNHSRQKEHIDKGLVAERGNFTESEIEKLLGVPCESTASP